jgi:hypothetical protein
MTPGNLSHAAAWLSVLLVLPLAPARAAGRGEIQPGAYCPLPARGEVPKCLAPARETWTDFFTAVEGGAAEPGLGAVEGDVERVVAGGADEEAAYLALSSLSYGYYRLAQRAAHSETADPEVTRRLARWNDLLAHAYRVSPDDDRYRAAVRQAALELHERAPIDVPCGGSQGARACRSTEDVLRDIDAAGERVGIRGALAGLLRRLLGGGEP